MMLNFGSNAHTAAAFNGCGIYAAAAASSKLQQAAASSKQQAAKLHEL